MISRLLGLLHIRTGEGRRLGLMATLLFLLIAASTLIKILRDSLFLGHHAVSELPYLYILVALIAGVVIAAYARHTPHLPLVQLILATNMVIIIAVTGFWFLFSYGNPEWGHYAFYIWSAMASVISVSQLWTLANQLFDHDEGTRLFGLLAAGGTIGGIAAGFGAQWTLRYSFASNHLLWCVSGIYLAASLLLFILRPHLSETGLDKGMASRDEPEPRQDENVFGHLSNSRYLKTIAMVILLSVVISTLFDFELKTAAKEIYPSKAALALFFSSYYGWLSVATLFSQVILTGRTLRRFGLGVSLYLTPATLLTGALSIMIWPGLLAPALSRIADATLRNSIHRSGMEILYMGVPVKLRRAIKTFLDVVVERLGDAGAGLIILLLSLSSTASYRSYVHFVCAGLVLLWIALIRSLRRGYAESLRQPTGQVERALPSESAVTSRARQLLGK